MRASFNPTVVRLRLGKDEPLAWGNILSIPLWCDCDLDTEFGARVIEIFQSHCGAIATNSCAVDATTFVAFNPTVVRLRPQVIGLIFYHYCTFNPTVVRLRRCCGNHTRDCLYYFQSHCGAIATRSSITVALSGNAFNPTVVRLRPGRKFVLLIGSNTFNPTVVRLRPESERHRVSQRKAFNPTVVRLRLHCKLSHPSQQKSFNPTVVRLRHGSYLRCCNTILRFQSHCGAIATRS